jgi:hypothetical protein
MNKYIISQNGYMMGLLVAAVAVLFCACTNDDVYSSAEEFAASGTETIVPKTIEADTSTLTESTEADDWDGSYKVTITLNDLGSTLMGDVSRISYTETNGDLVITSTKKGMEYVVSGTKTDGMLKIYSENKFKMTLNGVTINNNDGPAINNQGKKTLDLYLADGTTNTLTDGGTYATSTEDQKGTFFSEGQIVLNGTGTLNITSKYGGGLITDDYIILKPGHQLNVTSSAGHALKGKDGVYVNGGVNNLVTSADGAKALNSESRIEINGGRTVAIAMGTPVISGTDTTSVSAVKSDSSIYITAGTLNAKVTGNDAKAVNADYDITMTGGTLNAVATGKEVNSKPKAVKADGSITVNGGNAYACSLYGKAMDDSDGTITYQSTAAASITTHLITIGY